MKHALTVVEKALLKEVTIRADRVLAELTAYAESVIAQGRGVKGTLVLVDGDVKFDDGQPEEKA